MPEKEKQEESKSSSVDIQGLAGLMSRGWFRDFLLGCGVMAAILMFGYPVWQPIVDRYYDMESKKSDQSYDLQLKTFELIEGKVMAKLEDMQEDITALKEDFSDMRGDVKTLTDRVDGLEKKVDNIEEENAIVHAIYRKNK